MPDAAELDGIAAIVRDAPSPNRGWATLCETLAAAEPLARLSLADDALDLRARLTRLRAAHPIPRRVDTLAFTLSTKRRALLSPTGAWSPPAAEAALESLAVIHRAAVGQRGKARDAALLLLFGAAALIARFAADDLRYRIVVGLDGGPSAEVAARKPSKRRRS